MTLPASERTLRISLTETQQNYHPIIKYSFISDFKIKAKHLDALEILLSKYKLNKKYLECVALFFSQLTKSQETSNGKKIKRERREIEMKLNPSEFQKMKTIVQLDIPVNVTT